MRKLIAGMKISLDGKTADANGYADGSARGRRIMGSRRRSTRASSRRDVSRLRGLLRTAIREAPDKALSMTGKPPTPAEVDWAQFAAKTPHFVLVERVWLRRRLANTRFLRNTADVAALKRETGKDIIQRRRRPNDCEPDRGGARRRSPPSDLPGDRRLRAVAVCGSGRPARRRLARRNNSRRWAGRADLRFRLNGRARGPARYAAGRTGFGSGSAFAWRCAGGATRRSFAATTKARPVSRPERRRRRAIPPPRAPSRRPSPARLEPRSRKQIERAGLRLRRLHAQPDPARRDRVSGEKSDRHQRDAKNGEERLPDSVTRTPSGIRATAGRMTCLRPKRPARSPATAEATAPRR